MQISFYQLSPKMQINLTESQKEIAEYLGNGDAQTGIYLILDKYAGRIVIEEIFAKQHEDYNQQIQKLCQDRISTTGY